MKHLLLLLLAVVCCACDSVNNKSDKPLSPIGKYVYIDSRGILHSRKCYLGVRQTNDDGMDVILSIQFLDTMLMTSEHLQRLCPMCVEDAEFEALKRIVESKTMDDIIDYIPDVTKP